MRFLHYSFILTLFVLSSCNIRPGIFSYSPTPAPGLFSTQQTESAPEPEPSQTVVVPSAEATSGNDPDPTAVRQQISGDVYIVLRPVKPSFNLLLGRLPASCLLVMDGCPPIEIIRQDRDPKQPVLRQAPLVFSPDGKTIW